jgi:hypothetical protein
VRVDGINEGGGACYSQLYFHNSEENKQNELNVFKAFFFTTILKSLQTGHTCVFVAMTRHRHLSATTHPRSELELQSLNNRNQATAKLIKYQPLPFL